MENTGVAVVTGATAGIGMATFLKLMSMGYECIGVGRDSAKIAEAERHVRETYPEGRFTYIRCDLSSQTDVRKLARQIAGSYDRIDILANIAGTVSSHFMTSEDGIELQFAVNHLAPFLLTHELLPLLQKSKHGRIVTVSSDSHYGAKLNFNDLQMRSHYTCLRQYKRVKLCNVMFSAELNRRLGPGSTVKAFAADPGLVRTEIGLKGTLGIEKLFWKFHMKSGVAPSVPAEAIVGLVTDPALSASNEVYWYNGQPKRPNPYALLEDKARLLWEASERYCRIQPDGKEGKP